MANKKAISNGKGAAGLRTPFKDAMKPKGK